MAKLKEDNKAEYSLKVGSLEVVHNISGAGFTQIKRSVSDLQQSVSTVIAKTNNYWSAIAADNTITPTEKKELKRQWNVIEQTYTSIIESARAGGIDEEQVILDYIAAYEELFNVIYMNEKILDNMAESTKLKDPDRFTLAYNNYYDTEFEAQKAITKKETVSDVAPLVAPLIEEKVKEVIPSVYPHYLGAYTEREAPDPMLDSINLGDWYFNTTPDENGQVHIYRNEYIEETGGRKWSLITLSKETRYMFNEASSDLLGYADDNGDIGIFSEIFASNISALKIMFKEFIASVTSNPKIGDKLIAIGKNPANNGDTDYNFSIQKCISENPINWQKLLWTGLQENQINFSTTGNIAAKEGFSIPDYDNEYEYQDLVNITPYNFEYFKGYIYISTDTGIYKAKIKSDNKIQVLKKLNNYSYGELKRVNNLMYLFPRELSTFDTKVTTDGENFENTNCVSKDRDIWNSDSLYDIVYDGKYYYGIGTNGWRSENGITWSFIKLNTPYRKLYYWNNVFIAIGENDGRLYYSLDFNSWNYCNNITESVNEIAYGNGYYIAILNAISKSHYYSRNGIDWYQSISDETLNIFGSIDFNGSEFYIIGKSIEDETGKYVISHAATDLFYSDKGGKLDGSVIFPENIKCFPDFNLILVWEKGQNIIYHNKVTVINSDKLETIEAFIQKKRGITTLWEGNYYKSSGGSVDLADSIENYDAVIVAGKMYWVNDTAGEQGITMFIPKQLYYYASKNNASNASNEFVLNGSLSTTNNTRRLYFGFAPETPNKIFTGTMEGTSGHLPRLIGVYGINY